jgi:hypothetical protein
MSIQHWLPRAARAASIGAALVLAVSSVTSSAVAEPLTVQMTGQHRGLVGGMDRYMIPTYHVNFITSQQATAAASIMARTRLAMVLKGPDQAVMRRLTNEAYADLRAQMEAAGLQLVSPEETRALVQAAGYEDVPGNVEIAGIGPSITIGTSVRRGWATFGPDAAPALTAFRSMSRPMGIRIPIGGANRLARQLHQTQSIAIAPSLTLDFVNMSASTGSGILGQARASANGRVAFSVLMDSPVQAYKPAGLAGTGTPGTFGPRRDVTSTTPFAEVIEGGAEVRGSATLSDIADENYINISRARGDAVVVDMAVWEGLVRDAYRAYNAGIVQAIVSQRR